MLNKTKWKDDFIVGFQSTSQETQGYGINEFRVAHRLRDFYGINREVIWLFQLIGCLVVFFLTWIKVAESGEQGGWESEQIWYLGIGWYPVLCWLSLFCPWHKWLHFNLVVHLLVLRVWNHILRWWLDFKISFYWALKVFKE